VEQEHGERPEQQQVEGIQAVIPASRAETRGFSRSQQQDEQHHADAKIAQDEGAAISETPQVQRADLGDRDRRTQEEAEQRDARKYAHLGRKRRPSFAKTGLLAVG